ncbi:MAG: DegT/DnrJ/EryC1/StrS family aminotransferase [Desulfofustis sp.]|nr:DegT/DnrJ/EryC1/StrS family aminotransferase [Desulfofustis sp.]
MAWLTGVCLRTDTLEILRREVCERFGVRNGFFFSTGRAAMVVLLRALKNEAGGASGRDEVIIPSYTCFSVPSSIIKAGLKVRICDIDPATFDYDYEKLHRIDFSRVLCISSANLYGLPNDMGRLEQLAAEKDISLIDDAAQSMGALFAGKFSGTFGIAGIFSLDKGKVITSMNGGIIVTNSDRLARRIETEQRQLQRPGALSVLAEMVKMLVYSAFLRPHLYWLPARMPFLNLGATVYTELYPVARYKEPLSGMALQLLKKLDSINDIRISNGTYYAAALHDIPGIRLVNSPENARPIYLRFPILIGNAEKRERVLKQMAQRRLGATQSYPSSVGDIDAVGFEAQRTEDCLAGGRSVAAQIVTLPTHAYVNAGDRAEVVKICRQLGG